MEDAIQISLQIIGEAMEIPAKSPSPLFLITTITLILPLSFIQLLSKISFSYSSLTLYPTESIHDLFYFVSLFLFSLLSTSTIVFTVASLYASKSVSLYPTLFAIPRIFKHLLITFFYALLLKLVAYYLVMFTPAYVLDLENVDQGELLSFTFSGALLWCLVIIIAITYIFLHFYVIMLWNLASVISVVEPNLYGLAAMKKSKQLLQGRIKVAFVLVNLYFAATWIIGKGFGYAMQFSDCIMVKILLGLLILFMLVAVNFMGFLVQSVLYFACKSHHNEMVDKKVLSDHLCGYVNYPSTGGVEEVESLVKGQEKVGYQAVALDATTEV